MSLYCNLKVLHVSDIVDAFVGLMTSRTNPQCDEATQQRISYLGQARLSTPQPIHMWSAWKRQWHFQKGLWNASAVSGKMPSMIEFLMLISVRRASSASHWPKLWSILDISLQSSHCGRILEADWAEWVPLRFEEEWRRLLSLRTETGGLFRMASKMTQAEATKNKDINIDALMSLLGRYYQVKDDYQDIASPDVCWLG